MQHGDRGAVLARVDRKAERDVGLERVEAAGPAARRHAAWRQADAASLVPPQVDNYAATLGGDRGLGGVELVATVAAL